VLVQGRLTEEHQQHAAEVREFYTRNREGIAGWQCGDCEARVPEGTEWCPNCNVCTCDDPASAGHRKGCPHFGICELPHETIEEEEVCDARGQAHQSPIKTWISDKSYEVHDDAKPSVRAQLLDEAKRLVTGDRNAQYGPPTQDFSRTADLLTALGYRLVSEPTANFREDFGTRVHALQPSDIAIIMAQLKVSRLMHSRDKRDSWVDLAGYAACGAECAEEADE
jgi:hypothetical protein